ncbi:MAG: hypothetical protein IJV33_07625 [Bacteroidaceae bacterium]|nr:hypothetical protein [Bacteroidaceae bacterium]
MKKIQTKWLLWSSKVLAAAMAMLGFVTCTKESEDMYGIPVMYGMPPVDSVDVDSTMMEMYGTPYAKFRTTDENNETDDESSEEEVDTVLW